jgi:hypothetical protein
VCVGEAQEQGKCFRSLSVSISECHRPGNVHRVEVCSAHGSGGWKVQHEDVNI